MGLQIEYTTNFGVTANYHKIALVNIDWHRRKAHIELISYPDQATRYTDAYPLSNFMFDWSGDDFPFTFDGNNVEQAYTKIKSLPEWSSAVDV